MHVEPDLGVGSGEWLEQTGQLRPAHGGQHASKCGRPALYRLDAKVRVPDLGDERATVDSVESSERFDRDLALRVARNQGSDYLPEERRVIRLAPVQQQHPRCLRANIFQILKLHDGEHRRTAGATARRNRSSINPVVE